MLETHFSLAWEQHLNNITYGLSKFQQNGEFVDMTLAADGYFVKVHQMILSLVSPYLKEIITSTKCSHPVIFLNKISYKTLCSILDYIYKGEVQVAKSGLEDLIQAGKDLQIKGLQEMNAHVLSRETNATNTQPSSSNNDQNQTVVHFRSKLEVGDPLKPSEQMFNLKEETSKADDVHVMSDDVHTEEIECFSEEVDNSQDALLTKAAIASLEAIENKSKCADTYNNLLLDASKGTSPLHYTISLQGSLQLVVDKYIYNLRYNSPTASNHSQWKCVDYVTKKCPAFTVTRNGRVIQKAEGHCHPPHEEKISKKKSAGEIFTTYKTAEEYSQLKKKNKVSKRPRKS